MEFGQLIEYNMRNIFLKKYTCDAETIPRSLFKESKLNISLNQHSGILYSLFLLYVQGDVYQNILKLR